MKKYIVAKEFDGIKVGSNIEIIPGGEYFIIKKERLKDQTGISGFSAHVSLLDKNPELFTVAEINLNDN